MNITAPDCPHCTVASDVEAEHAGDGLFYATCPECGGGFRFTVTGHERTDDIETSAATATTSPDVDDVLALLADVLAERDEALREAAALRRGLEDVTRRAAHHLNA